MTNVQKKIGSSLIFPQPSLLIAAVQVTNDRFPLGTEPQARTKVRRGAHTQRQHGGHHPIEIILTCINHLNKCNLCQVWLTGSREGENKSYRGCS